MNNAYQKGKRWGFAVFGKNVSLFGRSDGAAISDKACDTCTKYSKTGFGKGRKPLTKEERAFYRGAAHGFIDYYRKKF